MPMPTLGPEDPIVQQRLQAASTPEGATIPQAVYSIACRSCGFAGPDRSFTAYPESAFRSPAELSAFAEARHREEAERKCPECDAMAVADGFRLFVPSRTLGGDLVVDADARGQTWRLLSPESGVLELPAGDPRIREACLDSCVNAATVLAEADPEHAAAAEALLRFAAAERPDSADTGVLLGRLLLREDRLPEALTVLQQASRNANGRFGACLGLGEVLGEIAFATRDRTLLQIAADWFQQALGLEPDHPAAHFGFGRLLLQAGNFEDARPHLERAAQEEAFAFEAAHELGVLALNTRRPEEAVRIFEKLADYAPEDAHLRRMLAWALSKAGRRSDALAALRSAVQLDPDDEENETIRGFITADDEDDDGEEKD